MTNAVDVWDFIDPETGELYENVEIKDDDEFLTILCMSRHDCAEQKNGWEKRQRMLDAQIIKRSNGQSRFVTEDLNVSIVRQNYTSTDALSFAKLLQSDDIPSDELLNVIAAASGFKKDQIEAIGNPTVKGDYADSTETKPKAAYVTSKIVLRRVPGS